jgi:hypothetical protein
MTDRFFLPAVTLLALASLWTSTAAASPACCGKTGDEAQTAISPPEQDRQAILAMAGEYVVTFQFKETVPIEDGYAVKDPYFSQATEFIEVLEDRGDFISLQHVLVLHPDEGEVDEDGQPKQPRVVKHWRQDWTYQDPKLLEFRGNRTWENVELTPEQVEGKWSQAVYQVDDSPRYEGVGRWSHLGGRSTWESDDTWRPLPRREYTKRSDYDVLVAKNRHTLTPDGWVHEQDNYKLVLEENGQPGKVIAHEVGLNRYDRTEAVDFSAGRNYWNETSDYWSAVRREWSDVLGDQPNVSLKAKVDDQRLYQALFEQAQAYRDADEIGKPAVIERAEQIIDAFIKTHDAKAAAIAP